MDAEREPLQIEVQSGFTAVMLAVSIAGCVMVTVLMLTQPIASFTVTVYAFVFSAISPVPSGAPACAETCAALARPEKSAR